MSSPDEPQVQSTDKRETWHFWRGTPELFAHVVRVAERALAAGEGDSTTIIDVGIREDHEVFHSADAFVQRVTIDALRHFSVISATVTSGPNIIEVTLRWTRPWWKAGKGYDADVILDVRGTSPEIEARHALVRQAILRGGTQQDALQAVIAVLLAVVGAALAAAFVLSAGYLLKVHTVALVAVFVGLAGFILGIYWGTWAYPSIEVAPLGQTNLRRLIRTAGPIVLTVILAGLTKKLFH